MFSVGFRNETTGVGPQPQFGAPHPRSAFVHSKAEEFYVCIYATREGDYVLFHHEGGVDVGDVDAKAQKLLVGVDEKLNPEDIKKHLLVHAPKDKKEILASFISGLFNLYEDLYFTYLEINPLGNWSGMGQGSVSYKGSQCVQ